MAENRRRFVILIDTNAMVLLSLYVESCRTVTKDLGISIADLKSAFENQRYVKENYLNFEEIKKGYGLYNHLKQKYKEFDGNMEVWFSLLAEVELLNVLLERNFDRELAEKGIPYRIRVKKPFRTQVDFNYEREVGQYWENMKETLATFDITFDNPEKDDGSIQDIVRIAKIVTRYVALGPVDLYHYASGIYLRANEIYTHDNELRTIINNICSKDKEWKKIYDNIAKDLRKFVRSFEDEHQKEGEISLLKGVPSGR